MHDFCIFIPKIFLIKFVAMVQVVEHVPELWHNVYRLWAVSGMETFCLGFVCGQFPAWRHFVWVLCGVFRFFTVS